MSYVTYLFGAGASCQCLPTYQNFSTRFRAFRKFLDGYGSSVTIDDRVQLEKLKSQCEDLLYQFNFHSTPDTIAKKYFHQKEDGQTKLNTLKVVLTVYFIYEQCAGREFILANHKMKEDNKQVTDKRYDTFIAAILEPNYQELKLPPDINILTYNYDTQFEICFNQYLKRKLSESQEQLITVPLTLQSSMDENKKRFTITHLNGIAYSESSNGEPAFPVFCMDGPSLINHVIHHYISLSNQEDNTSKNMVYFAWERGETYPYKSEALDYSISNALQVATKTEVLVIVGYSFPIFNRPLDTLIVSEMKNLSKIYIQSPVANEMKQTLTSAFEHLNQNFAEDRIIALSGTDYFHIPNEYYGAPLPPPKGRYSIV